VKFLTIIFAVLLFLLLNFANLHRNWSPPYFYFWCNWPTDLESASHVSALAVKVSTKFKVDTTICWPVIALLRDLVTLTFDLLTLVSGHTCQVTWSIPPPSLKILRLSVLESWVLTSPIGYHWQWVCNHCACATPRDLWVGGKFYPHIWNHWPRFAYSLYNFYGATIKTDGLIRQNSVWLCA